MNLLDWEQNGKWEYTDSDFGEMGWHDVHIHAIAFPSDEDGIVFDIDYILEWVQPSAGEDYYKFWVAPATLVFPLAYSLDFDIGSSGREIEMAGMSRTTAGIWKDATGVDRPMWNWNIECVSGEIRFIAPGLKLYIRRPPIYGTRQRLSLAERHGYSFEMGRTDLRD